MLLELGKERKLQVSPQVAPVHSCSIAARQKQEGPRYLCLEQRLFLTAPTPKHPG